MLLKVEITKGGKNREKNLRSSDGVGSYRRWSIYTPACGRNRVQDPGCAVLVREGSSLRHSWRGYPGSHHDLEGTKNLDVN